MKLSDLGEFGFIERIRNRAGSQGVRLSIGDDCAAVEVKPGELLLTTKDLLIEEVHFRRDWTDLYLLGRKSISVNISDVAAMGGRPRHLFLGLAIATTVSVEDLDAFIAGVLAAADDYGVQLIGGDTCRSPGPMIISVTVQGTVPEKEMVCRSGARAGDAIYVSGTLGDSALALQALLAGKTPPARAAGRHHDPRARVELGRSLAAAGIPSAMIDVSDGLLADLGHILEESRVGGRIEEKDIPLSAEFKDALRLGQASLDLALCGGEDYELLLTVPPSKEGRLAEMARQFTLDLTRIGQIKGKEAGFERVDASGVPRPATLRGGYNHFAR